jgi:hypothetical protein
MPRSDSAAEAAHKVLNDDESWAEVVDETERDAIVAKLGRAAETAIELDPRSEG